jgi:alpha,alpha-trehalase
MRLRSFIQILILVLGFQAFAQTPALKAAPETTQYIHAAWSSLTRSMSDCKSFEDVKVSSAPLLYVPAGTSTVELQKHLAVCHVTVRALPKPIHAIGDTDPASIPQEGLLFLPKPYVVPGGRFNEMYGWDSYFILRGLIADDQRDLARGMVENFFYEIEHYGGVLNANRTYYLTRSQPPFLTSMIRAVYESGPRDRDKAWLARAYRAAVQDHALWLRPEHQGGTTGLARYFDYGSGPVPEMRDDDSYYAVVAEYALLHPVEAPYVTSGSGQSKQSLRLTLCREVSSAGSAACAAPIHIALTSDYYQGDRAMRESGFDPSFRFGPYSGRTQHFAPVCLNSLLYKVESDLAWMAEQLGLQADVTRWTNEASARRDNINKYLWSAEKGSYFDYGFETQKQSDYVFATMMYPLWSGVASPQQAAGVRKALVQLSKPGGIEMSTFDSGTQWDAPYGWAPLQLLAAEGLTRYGFGDDAKQIAREFTSMVDENLRRDGTIREKYNVETRSSETHVTAGYAQNVVGFGWTNGVYLVLKQMLQ